MGGAPRLVGACEDLTFSRPGGAPSLRLPAAPAICTGAYRGDVGGALRHGCSWACGPRRGRDFVRVVPHRRAHLGNGKRGLPPAPPPLACPSASISSCSDLAFLPGRPMPVK